MDADADVDVDVDALCKMLCTQNDKVHMGADYRGGGRWGD